MLLNKNNQPKNINKIVIPLTVLVILVLSFITMYFSGFFNSHHDSRMSTKNTPTIESESVNNQKGETHKQPSSHNNKSTAPDNSTKDNGTIKGPLVVPSGDFVSNHHPNLGGSPAPNSLSSVCTSTPGASCTISFTQGKITKSLPTQTTDQGGSTYWNNWTLQGIGLTTGSWKITATSSLGNKTLSSVDPMGLEVQP